MSDTINLRLAKFHFLGLNELAPVVGEISEKRDTIFIKQLSGGR